MTIPISQDVVVNISLETLFPTSQGFSTAMILGTTDVIDQGERVRFYANIDEVAADFASIDEELRAATIGFSQNPRPTRLGIGRAFLADTAGFIVSGVTGLFAIFSPIADGAFNITIDGDASDVTACNFTGDADMDDVAATIQTRIRTVAANAGWTSALVTHDGVSFTITSGTTGDSSTVSVMTAPGSGTDISGPTLCNALTGPTRVVPGHTFTDLDGELTAIEAANDDWYGLALTRDLRTDANAIAAAAWCLSRTKLFAAFTDNPLSLDAQSTGDLAFVLNASGQRRSFVSYSAFEEEYLDVSALIRQLIVDYDVPDSASTLKFKQMPGTSVNGISSGPLNNLLDKKGNTYFTQGGFAMYANGTVADGNFVDMIHSIDWLQNTVAVGVFGAMATPSTKIPMTDPGAAVLENATRVALEQAVTAGVIAEDFDDEGNLVPAYTLSTVPVLDLPVEQRAERTGPAITFTARGAGAIHGITVTGTVTV